MEYVFGRIQGGYENIKTIGTEHSSLSGHCILSTKYPDQTITDEFDIVEKYESKDDAEGRCYDWYSIINRQRTIDKSEAIKEDYQAQIDYVMMMSGIIRPQDEEVPNEQN